MPLHRGLKGPGVVDLDLLLRTSSYLEGEFGGYDIILYCVMPHYALLYYTILYYTILYYTILCSTLLYSTPLHSTLLYSTLLYCTVLYRTVLYYALLYCTVLYSTLLYSTLLYYIISCYYVMLNCIDDGVRALFEGIVPFFYALLGSTKALLEVAGVRVPRVSRMTLGRRGAAGDSLHDMMCQIYYTVLCYIILDSLVLCYHNTS